MSDDKDCYELMEDAMNVMNKMKHYDNGYGDYDFWLSGIRSTIKSIVSDVQAGKALPADFVGQWDFVVADSLDHMLSQRLAGMPRKANDEPDFKKWSKGDAALYKLFDELTAIVMTLIETCKPDNEARIAASRAAKGLPNVATRSAAKAAAAAERKAANAAAAQVAKNARAAERQAAKNAKDASNKAAANAKKAAMTNEERAAAANRAAKAAATRKAKKNAERAAGEALLAANNGRRPKRNVSRKKGNNNA